MAQSYVTPQGTLIIPGAYAQYTVQTSNSGLSTTGVLMLMGEADSGPDFTLESDLSQNLFGPNQMDQIVAKYGAGRLVDACFAASSPANDPNIQGSPQGFIICKTNPSTKATSNLLDSNSAAYATLADQSYGATGNLLNYSITSAVAEVLPTTGAFLFLPPIGTINYGVRVNGGLSNTGGTISAETLPPAIVTNLDGVSGLNVSGGTNRAIITSIAGTLAVSIVSGDNVTITISTAWATNPTVGDVLVIPTGSAIEGGGNVNVGSYVVTGVTNTTISATKLMNLTGSPGSITAPAAVSATNVAATTDVQAFAPITVTLSSATLINGFGKSLVFEEVATGTDLLSNCLYVYTSGSVSKVTWISKTGTPAILASAAETAVSMNVNRATDNVQETMMAGGQVVLQLSYEGTSAQVVVGPTSITASTVGGTGSGWTVTLKAFPVVASLVQFINAQTGWSAQATTAILGTLPTTALDEGTFTCGSTFGELTGRIKADAYRFFQAVSTQSAHVQLGNPTPVQPASGLPGLKSTTFLSGGALGATSNATITAALAALQVVSGNFLVPLFSADAVATDIPNGNTDPSSTYTIASINAAASQHVTLMSTLKRQRNRQAFLSIEDNFHNQQTAAANIANYRCSMCFQDIRTTSISSGIVQYQPWMGAVYAAGIQAAGFYKGIVHKYAALNGVIQAAGDFNDQDDDEMEAALQAGLLPLKRSPTGGFYFVSDQTTYGKDNNFVFNSIQATYVADTISLTTAQRMNDAFTGMSVADISASLALAFIETIMADFLRLKLIAPSDDNAPKGYKNVVVRLSGTALVVSAEVKVAGLIYFVPINFFVSPVQQTASS